ncbi:hypothetical protein [Parasedimentitalea huanghaiensis]|uniref:Uncharacterized protein n=1 Tax=Parasedimentitalea huanghaiensis TaxID=2682100 RepID=A0A6L6WHM6_9RHOB|nr:hypothetical protein [Zongyanglinia huanghaiensis]MVO17353.1 hypothetical protein [Zongyanglinia huanghaiensis]
MSETAAHPLAKSGALHVIMMRLRSLFGRAKLTPEQAETLATIKFPCC